MNTSIEWIYIFSTLKIHFSFISRQHQNESGRAREEQKTSFYFSSLVYIRGNSLVFPVCLPIRTLSKWIIKKWDQNSKTFLVWAAKDRSHLPRSINGEPPASYNEITSATTALTRGTCFIKFTIFSGKGQNHLLSHFSKAITRLV